MTSKFNKGFTLIEVLITVAILSTAIIFVFRSFAASLSSVRFSQNITLASFLAEDKIWQIEEAYITGIQPEYSGSQVIQNKDFKWNCEILDLENPDLKELKFIISWKEKLREKEYPIEILTFLPAKE